MLSLYSFSHLYCSHFSYFQKKTRSLLSPILISTLSFVDNEILISQEKSYENQIQTSFAVIRLSLFTQFSLVIEHDKVWSLLFLRSTKNIHPSSLDLYPLDSLFLYLKDTWRYLGFIFDKKPTFQHYIYYYTNKALSTIKSMKMLGNSKRGLFLIHKRLLYRML